MTYRVRAGEREAMYGNMPVIGLATRHVPIGRSSTAARRIAERNEDRPPVEAY